MKARSAWLKKIKQQTERSDKQKGVALVVTLLVMLVLLLLALSLSLQSQTEYIIAVNEQDSMVALSFAEGILDRGNRAVKDYMAQSPEPTDLTDFLEGVDDAPGGGDDNLPDFNEFTTVDLAGGWSALAALTTGNEKTTAVKVSKDFGFGDGSKDYLAYRRGVDTTSPADGVWDGPRSVVYVRFDDNYDSGTTLDTTDNDFRMRMRVVSEYPYHTDSSGAFVDKFFLTAKQRGLAQRKLIADFAPAGHVAIRTDGDLNINGSLELCGECGGAHANGTINVGLDGGGTCAELSGTEGYTVDASAGPFLNAPVVQTGEVFIPIINPWDDRYVPDPGVFKTFSNNTIPANLRCPTNGADRSIDDDPGATKYFALVVKKVAGSQWFRVYKAYWDSANTHWVWRLIGDNQFGAAAIDVELDDCGRVVSGNVNGKVLEADPFAGTAVIDGGDDEFYGFAPNSNYDAKTCVADETLGGTYWNDFNYDDAWIIDEDNYTSEPIDTSDYTKYSLNTDADYNDTNAAIPLPGSVRTHLNLTDIPPSVDNNPEFVPSECIDENAAEIRHKNTAGGSVVYSSNWGAVHFMYGNLQLNGGKSFKDSTGAVVDLEDANVNSRWKTAFIVSNNINFQGNPIYGSVDRDNFPAVAIAGRDIKMAGTGGAGPGNQDQCPDMSGDCTAPPANPAGYEGMYLAHEEIWFTGNVTVSGFLIAEDAAECASLQDEPSVATGSVQIHYDCEHPADPWQNKTVGIVSWEEVQSY